MSPEESSNAQPSPSGEPANQQAPSAESNTLADDSRSLSIFVPFLIFSLSFALFLAWQLSNVNSQHAALENTLKQQEAAVQQSSKIQAALTKLYGDLLETAKTDDHAKAIAQKYANVLHLNPPAEPAK